MRLELFGARAASVFGRRERRRIKHCHCLPLCQRGVTSMDLVRSCDVELGSDVSLGFAQLIQCPTATAMVLAIAEDQPAVDAMQTLIAAGRCMKPGDKPQDWPDGK